MCYPILMLKQQEKQMKSLKLGDIVWADWYKATVYSLPNIDGDMQIILDEGLWTETVCDCSIHDIALDSDGERECIVTGKQIGRAHV